jgi:hypothetical protein
MKRISVSTRISALAVGLGLAVLIAGAPAIAKPWSFGVMADTQWAGTDPTGNNKNTVAVNQITAVNKQFVKSGVNFVVQVGDLCDKNGSDNAALQTRLNANTDLNAAGIAFYGLRGNHESGSGSQTFFQNNYIPTSTASAIVAKATDNTSYSVTYNNTKVVLLDISMAGNTTNLNNITPWMNTQLSASDHNQAFVFSHKNLLGQNHKDSQFGSSNDANPTQQNAFLAALANNGVRYAISGHDHMHHRSIVKSPDGNSSVQQIICASDSYKYYTPGSPYSSRETPIAQELFKTGYYIYTVDGPRVTGQYYATTPLANGDVAPDSVFTLQDTFGYSTNGKEFLVGAGESYTTVQDSYNGTIAQILDGTNGSSAKTYDGRTLTKDINTGWTDMTTGFASNILTLWGLTDLGSDVTDTFVLSLSYDPSKVTDLRNFGLVTREFGGNWTVAGTNFVTGAWNSSYGLGTYGVDLANNTAWAVLNHNSDFAVSSGKLAPVPEPATLLGFGVPMLMIGLGKLKGLRK